MDEHVAFVTDKRLQRVKAAIDKNGMVGHVVQTAAEVPTLVKELLPPGCGVSHGGSETLKACGVIDLLQNGGYDYHNRSRPGITPEEKKQVERDSFSLGYYLTSANAVTEAGELLLMDGFGNRVAAVAFGPDKVIFVVGCNKIVPDLAAARRRVAEIAAPANCHRLSCETPCATTSQCIDCASPGRICCLELILHQQIAKGRIHVILVGEALGY